MLVPPNGDFVKSRVSKLINLRADTCHACHQLGKPCQYVLALETLEHVQ